MRPLITALISLGLASASGLHAENLDDIYRAALQNNPMLLGAEAQLKSRQELANIQKAALLPTIGASLSYGYAESNSVTEFSSNYKTFLNNTLVPSTPIDSDSQATGTEISGQIGISQALVDFYSWYAFKGSKKISEQAQLDFASTQQQLIVNTVQGYLNVLRAKETLASALAEETAIKQRLEQTQQRYNVGLAAITEVHEAQSAFDLSKVARIASEGNLAVAYEGLGLLTGKAHDNVDNISENYPVTALAEDMDTWIKVAMENNLDLLMAKKGVEASEYAIKAAKARHYPLLSAAASYSDASQNGEVINQQGLAGNTFKTTDDDASVMRDTLAAGITLTIPIYTGGATQASVRKAAAENQIAIQNRSGTQRSITQKIRALHIAAMTRMEQVNARKQAIVSSQSALDAIQAGYDVGTRNIVDVLTAQRNVYAAQRDYANARFDYILSLFELKQTAGTLTPGDIQALNEWTTAQASGKP